MSPLTRQNRTRWFSELSARLGLQQDPVLNLMVELKVDEQWFDDLRDAVMGYIRACLGCPADLPSEQSLVETAGETLANRSASGLLIPKQEFQSEYNQLHKVVAAWYRSLGIDDLVYQFVTPLVIRLIKGQAATADTSGGYGVTELHADAWQHEPFDFVNVMLPLLGDTENTTTEVYHPPEDFEDKYLRRFSSFDVGRELDGHCQMYPALRRGYAYFVDAILPHRAVQKGGGTRVTLSTPIRRSTTDAERREVELQCGAGRLDHYVDCEEWLKYGTSKFLKFKDTYADARKGIYNEFPYDSPLYDVVDSLS